MEVDWEREQLATCLGQNLTKTKQQHIKFGKGTNREASLQAKFEH